MQKKLVNRKRYYNSLSILSILIEIVLLLVVIGSFISFFICLGYLIYSIFAKTCNEILYNLISCIGVFASISFIPISGIIVSLILAYRNSFNEIENDLAKCIRLEVYLRRLPRGAGFNSSNFLQAALIEESNILNAFEKGNNIENSVITNQSLVDYSYQIEIMFRQDFAEFYNISLCDVDLINVVGNEEYVLNLRNIDRIKYAPSIIYDNAGILSKDDGEHIELFLKEQPDEQPNNLIKKKKNGCYTLDKRIYYNDADFDNFLNETFLQGTHYTKRFLHFELNFRKKDYSQKGIILFPIFRKLVEGMLACVFKRRVIVTELEYELSRDNSRYSSQNVAKLHVLNISFKIKRNLTWVKYLSQRYKNDNL